MGGGSNEWEGVQVNGRGCNWREGALYQHFATTLPPLCHYTTLTLHVHVHYTYTYTTLKLTDLIKGLTKVLSM